MTRVELLDYLLKRLYEHPPRVAVSILKICTDELGFDSSDMTPLEYTEELIEHGVAERFHVDYLLSITPNGRRFYENGGFKQYYANLDKEHQDQQAFNSLQKQELQSSIDANNRNRKHFRWNLVFMIVNTLLAALNIYLLIKSQQ